ncbi:MAG: lytic transglycosylase domain-containing protein [Hyphomicrobiales bacterium]|nr:lytic transglycosylase domain-containing protein [Hyphomicrobiales bacterium]
MRDYEFLAPLAKPIMTVFFTVATCATVLFVVQPWQTQARDGHATNNLSASLKGAALVPSAPEQVAPKSGRENPPASISGAAPKAALSSGSEPALTASVKKTDAFKKPAPRPRQHPSNQAGSDEKAPVETKQTNAGRVVPSYVEEIHSTTLNSEQEILDIPDLPVRAPHHEERLQQKRDKRAQQFSTPWSKAESDKALQPLFSYSIGNDDIEALKEVVELTFKQKFTQARKIEARLTDPVARKFARWYFYRNKAPDTQASDIIDFLDKNPLWPGREETEAAIEDALFWREGTADVILSYFAGREPTSGVGYAALGIALIEKERKAEGVKRIKQAWRGYVLSPAIEKKIRLLKVLDAEDHYARAGFLLIQDKKRYVNAVKRILPLIAKDRRSAVKAHMATVRRARNAGTQLTNLDPKIKEDPQILYARAQWLRRNKNDEKARKLLTSAPNTAEELIVPKEWWKERRRHIRSALDEGNAGIAYTLAAKPNAGLEHWDLSEAEFLAGWIAFRFLNKPDIARKHFLTAIAAGGLPKRRSRAAYWLGRIESAAGNHNEARARYTEAAEHHHTFYGQLAHQMIAGPDALLSFRQYTRPTQGDINQFVADDVSKAMVIAQKADFNNLLSLFMYDRAREIKSAPQIILLCELASRIAPPHHTVRMAKIAINRDFPVEHYAYPRALPEFSAIASGQNVEKALIHALTRQESEFNPGVVSPAGAVGLMQLLPSTAKFVARRNKVPYAKRKLSSDPAYNVSLGSAFLHQLISNYDGSYIMALAGYNAGPGRVRRWSKELGDPRDSKVDPIDWIERIPFTETRDYVHKILESAQVYRSRLLNENAQIRLAEDLHRGRKDKPKFLLAGQTASN